MNDKVITLLENMIKDYPALAVCREDILAVFTITRDAFKSGGKLLLCGNGGSAADCEHISSELMKGFLMQRPLDSLSQKALSAQGDAGIYLASKLQGALPCISLVNPIALNTAFANDIDSKLIFAQQVMGLGTKHDVIWGVSTSGNAENVQYAIVAAKSKGIKAVGLTGKYGGELFQLCDICIRVPEERTYKVQEYHLPIYHALCAMFEVEFY